jgi:hypothetical protein
MYKQLKLAICAASLAMLVACGGGGGENATTTPAAEKTFPLQQIFQSYLNSPHSYTSNTTADLAGTLATNTGTRSIEAQKSTVFENKAAFVVRETRTTTDFQPGLPESTSIIEDYYDASGQAIGFTQRNEGSAAVSNYAVIQGSPIGFPMTAKISDSGNLSSLAYYFDPTKKQLGLNGTRTWTLKEGFGGAIATLEVKETLIGVGAVSGTSTINVSQYSIDSNNNMYLVKTTNEAKAGSVVISLTATLTGK